jgi:cysteine desulfurase
MVNAVYMDHNATTPMRPEVAAATARALAVTGNASSVHRFGRMAHRALEDAREKVAALVGAAPEDVVFTSGGTEANNLAIRGAGRARVLVSAVEHVSVLKAAAVEIIPVDGDGVVDRRALETRLAADDTPTLVSVMLANNETGVIQPVADIAALARRFGALVHCDAVQAAGRTPIDMGALGVDLLTVSAHKIGGPPGVGALVVGARVPLKPEIVGGGQERGRRAGTENTPAIVGFGLAADGARTGIEEFQRLAAWRDRIEDRVRRIAPAVRVFGAHAPRLANTTCFTMPGVASETQVMGLDLAGIAVSAGAACSSGKVQTSHVLKAMGVDAEEADCAIRVSLGWTSEEADIDRFVEAWGALYARAGRDARLAAPAA